MRDDVYDEESFPIDVENIEPRISWMTPVSGPRSGGTTVTIEGQDFGSNPTVYFGDDLATVVACSSTTLIVDTPDIGAGHFEHAEVRIVANGDEVGGWYFVFE